MIKVEDIVKQIIQEIYSIFPKPKYNIYLGTLEENAQYPCFLVYLGLNNSNVFDTNLTKKTLSVNIVYFNSNKKRADIDYISKVRVADIFEENFLSKFNLKVNGSNVKMEYEISDADDLLNITLKLTYFNNIAKETIDYELMKEFIYRLEIK